MIDSVADGIRVKIVERVADLMLQLKGDAGVSKRMARVCLLSERMCEEKSDESLNEQANCCWRM
jgi:hypothetical protein